jgi:tight adherence protein C
MKMSDPVPEVLQAAAALLAAAFVSALAIALLAVHGNRRQAGRMRATPLAALAAANERWMPEARLEQVDGWLRKAGRPRDLSAARLVALMQAGAAMFLGCGTALSLWLGLGPGICLACPLAGALYPLIWVRDRVRARHRAIARALPYALDLLMLSVEAGLDFSAALTKVVEKGRAGPLAQELSVVLKELKLGKSREEALRNLQRRVDLPALTSFVHALVHADRMGTPLGKVLRVLSTELRVERTHRAEKLANEAPVKLLLPLVLCIFPTLFLMLFGPLAHQMLFQGGF